MTIFPLFLHELPKQTFEPDKTMRIGGFIPTLYHKAVYSYRLDLEQNNLLPFMQAYFPKINFCATYTSPDSITKEDLRAKKTISPSPHMKIDIVHSLSHFTSLEARDVERHTYVCNFGRSLEKTYSDLGHPPPKERPTTFKTLFTTHHCASLGVLIKPNKKLIEYVGQNNFLHKTAATQESRFLPILLINTHDMTAHKRLSLGESLKPEISDIIKVISKLDKNFQIHC